MVYERVKIVSSDQMESCMADTNATVKFYLFATQIWAMLLFFFQFLFQAGIKSFLINFFHRPFSMTSSFDVFRWFFSFSPSSSSFFFFLLSSFDAISS